MKTGIACCPSMGGPGIIATGPGTKVVERGHEIHFVTSDIPFRIRKPLPSMAFHQVGVNQYAIFQYPPYDITLNIRISDVIQECDLGILHMHYAVPHVVCGILAKQMSDKNVKIMTTLHGTDMTVLGYDHTLQDTIKFGVERSDIVTSINHSLAQQAYEIINVKKGIIPIYNFVRKNESPARHNEELKDCYGISPEEKVSIHVSSFRKVKRIDTVIETFVKVYENIPSKLILLEDSPGLVDVRHETRELNIETHVLFLGKQNGVSASYQLSGLVLPLSERESFGLAPLGAMKTGVSPMGNHTGGIKEAIRYKETGFIVDVGDGMQAAKYAVRLLSDPELYRKMQSQMLKDIEARFNSDLITDQYENYYRKMPEQGENSNES